jgi:hypothetical protein
MTSVIQVAPFVISGRDFGQMQRHGKIKCRRCTLELKEGDMIYRVGQRPVKYYHKNCFKVIP